VVPDDQGCVCWPVCDARGDTQADSDMIRTRFGYTLLLGALLPRALLQLLWRSRVLPAYREHVPERFGFYGAAASTGPLVWVHAVSVGETRAAEPLIRALQRSLPGHRILLTHMTPTGRQTGASLFGDEVLCCYLPYDFPGAVARFIGHFRPRLGILMETEIWPNLIYECHRRGMPLYLVNARLSEKSGARYRRAPELTRDSLRRLTTIAAQSHDDARRFAGLGAQKVTVTGNMKFDVQLPAAQLTQGESWRLQLAGRQVVLAASTRDGEEALLLDILPECKAANALLLIVPRHPQRFDAIAQLLTRRGIRYQRRSTHWPRVNADTEVVLGDSMGEMFAYCACCDLAFIGGSLLPFGGQNLIEPLAVGRPVLIGPHTYNFAEITEQAVAAGAAIRVADARELARELSRLLADRGAAAVMAGRAREFAAEHQGSTQRVLDVLGVG